MILGKSNHPVEIKQIPMLVWSLRSEIEIALQNCLDETGQLNDEKAKRVRDFYDCISYPDKAKVESIDKTQEQDEKKSEGSQDEPLKPGCHRPEEKNIFNGKSLLSDIQMENIIFFSEKEFTPGQTITLEMVTSQPFCLYLRVENVMNFSRDSKIIASKKMSYRILGKVLFPFEEQRIALRNFLQKIEPRVIAQERENSAKKDDPKNEGTEDASPKTEEEKES